MIMWSCPGVSRQFGRFKSSLELMLCVIDISTLNKTFLNLFEFEFGTNTFRHPLKKTVRHQESLVLRQIGTRTKRHRIFFQTNMISFFKIKSKKVKKNPSMIV